MLFSKFRVSLLVLCCLVCSVPAFAQNRHLVGLKVMTIKWETEFKEDTTVIFKSPLGEVYEVDKVNGEWLWLVGDGRSGWVKSSDVVPYEQAIDHFTRLVQQDGSFINYINRAFAWRSKGELDIALGDMNEAIRLVTLSDLNRAIPLEMIAAVYSFRGGIWKEKGEYDKAIADYNEAIRLCPNIAENHRNRGIVWNAIAENHRNRGVVWTAKGEYDKAIADFNEAIRLYPKYTHAYYNRGVAWNAKGEYDKAIADWNEVIRLGLYSNDVEDGILDKAVLMVSMAVEQARRHKRDKSN